MCLPMAINEKKVFLQCFVVKIKVCDFLSFGADPCQIRFCDIQITFCIYECSMLITNTMTMMETCRLLCWTSFPETEQYSVYQPYPNYWYWWSPFWWLYTVHIDYDDRNCGNMESKSEYQMTCCSEILVNFNQMRDKSDTSVVSTTILAQISVSNFCRNKILNLICKQNMTIAGIATGAQIFCWHF